MRIQLDTVAEIGKALSIRRQTVASDAGKQHVVACTLAFSTCYISHEQATAIVGFDPMLWDFLGEPMGRVQYGVPFVELTFVGTVGGSTKGADKITLADATLSAIQIAPMPGWGAALSGRLRWQAAGDEAEDLNGLLGQTCALVGALHDAEQGAMLDPPSRTAPIGDSRVVRMSDGTTGVISRLSVA